MAVPYAAGTAEIGPSDPADPFHDGRTASASIGLDLHRKIGAAFALDATVNPDFGQVEVDPAVVNLTDFETFFPERRPFFVEGAQIFDSFGRNGPNNFYYFNRSEPDLFYTRRIGRAPQGSLPERLRRRSGHDHDPRRREADGEERGRVERRRPRGRHRRRERALGERDHWGRQTVEPLTNYLVGRAFRDAGRAGYGFLVTSVLRDIQETDARRSPRRARSRCRGSTATCSWTRAGTGSSAGESRGASVAGDRGAIEQLQLGSTRYFQRPDREAPRLDPTLTSLEGWTGSVDLNRQSGAVRVNASAWATSPGFESNDLGFNPRSDRWGGHVAVQLQKPEPDGFTRFRALTLSKSYAYNFDGDKQADAFNAGARVYLRNYWSAGLNGGWRWRGLDDRQARGGPSMTTAQSWSGGLLGGDGRPPAGGRPALVVLLR